MDNVGECAVVQYILRVRDREEDAHELNEKKKNKRKENTHELNE